MNKDRAFTTRREFVCNIALAAISATLIPRLEAKSTAFHPIVTPDWLSTNLGDSKLVVLDIRSIEQYKKGHIPGSINVPLSAWAISSHGLLLELPSENTLCDLVGNAGISADSRVVIVNRVETDFSRADPMRVAWTLKIAGIGNTAVLDGGYNRWLKDIKVISAETASPKSVPYAVKMNRNFEASKEYVLQKIGKSVIVDTRLPEDYFGITSKSGHIKSALNLPLPWAFTEDGTFRKPEILAAMATGVIGAAKSKEIILYCGVGGFAAAWWFLLTRVLGYENARVYDGSMEEWEKDPNAPVSSYSWH